MRRPGKLYVRTGPLPDNTAIQDYDVGTVIFCLAGTPSEVMGSVYVDYTIKLTVPQPYNYNQLTALSVQQSLPVPQPVSNIWNYQTSQTYRPYNDTRETAELIVDPVNNTVHYQGADFTQQIFNYDIHLAGDVSSGIVDSVVTALETVKPEAFA